MTTSPPPGSAGGARVQTKITVPDDQQMVNLLGARDDVLKLVERSLNSDIHVRGNEITISGTPADNALAERVFAELLREAHGLRDLLEEVAADVRRRETYEDETAVPPRRSRENV